MENTVKNGLIVGAGLRPAQGARGSQVQQQGPYKNMRPLLTDLSMR